MFLLSLLSFYWPAADGKRNILPTFGLNLNAAQWLGVYAFEFRHSVWSAHARTAQISARKQPEGPAETAEQWPTFVVGLSLARAFAV